MSISSLFRQGKEKAKTDEEKESLAHEFLARFYVIKVHQWRGKLKRIFCIGHNTVATIDPSALFKLTNEWRYGVDFHDALPKTGTAQEFTITVGKKMEVMVFSTPYRAEILTQLQKQRKKFALRDQHIGQYFGTKKLQWNETWKPCSLSLAGHGVVQIDQHEATKAVGCYEYWLINEVGNVSDVPGGFYISYGSMKRIHVYQCDRKDDLTKRINEFANKYIGHTGIQLGEDITMAQVDRLRTGIAKIEDLMSVSEFSVAKATPRYETPVRRQLCITDAYIVERDPTTYNVVAVRQLAEIFALIRSDDDSQAFQIEFKENVIKTYNSTERDSLLASLQDAVRRAGNLHCCIKMSCTERGQRTGSLADPVHEEVESTLLKVLGDYAQRPDSAIVKYPQVIEYFNNNVEYSGLNFTENKDSLFAENKERMIQKAIVALLDHTEANPTAQQVAGMFYALRRLAASPTGFMSFTKIPGFVKRVGKSVIVALKMRHDAVSHAAIDFLSALLYPMNERYNIFTEQANRRALLANQQFLNNLVVLLQQHALANTGALVVSALLDFFVFALCPPYSDTTDAGNFDPLLSLLATGAGPAMFRLYLHPCVALGVGAGMLMKTIVTECDEQAKRLQRFALSEGTLLRQFHLAMWGKNADLRELAVQLIGLWTIDCAAAQELLKRMIPMALLSYLQSKEEVPEGERVVRPASPMRERKIDGIPMRSPTGIAGSHWRIKMGVPTPYPLPPETPSPVLRKPRNIVNVTLNWEYFFYQLNKDHLRPDVIWNHHTREELREKIEKELALLSQGSDTRRGHEISWNHVEFEVLYECLKDEIQIGPNFLRILLEDPDPKIHNPREFFYDLYHRYLLIDDKAMKSQCMHGMARLYETHAASIGVFNDLSFIVGMLRKAQDKIERDRLLQFLCHLLRVKGNVKLFIDCNGMPVLIDLLTLAHLHHDRPQLKSQSNVIEMNPSDKFGSEPEWYYQDADGTQCGPVSLDDLTEMYKEGAVTKETSLWAQGMDAWYPMEEVPQLKWCLIYPTPQGFLNPTQVAVMVLDMLNRMCDFYPSRNEDGILVRPVPRVKRMLADPTVLPHIAQIMLTLDPELVNRSAKLLCSLMQDNQTTAGRLYLSGAFFFALMYMGSDILPMCRLFKLTHTLQAHCSGDDENNSRSFLSTLLPRSMVSVLSNHGAEKFAEVFLGEFDNPEAIWGNDMRTHLVQQIAVHLQEFTPKLMSNTRAIYTYCPITPVQYEQLDGELFCSSYYLRHLCDTQRYPDWPITNQIELLRESLQLWKKELEKTGEGQGMDEAKAMAALEMDESADPTDVAKVRKKYFVLAAKYHPDKNPDGRERFEEILRAYEWLANPKRPSNLPDPKRIELLIRTQTILHKRFKDVLVTYKYPGYPMLLKHIDDDIKDPELFALTTPLSPAAAELCFYTVNTSPLNAEELLREGGFALLKDLLVRCMDVVGENSKDGDMAVAISTHIIEMFARAAEFETCRAAIIDMPVVTKVVAKGVMRQSAPRLSKACIACCSAFAAGRELQDQLYENGVLWHLLQFVFGYDYTLDEAGVEKSAESNVQELKNLHAKAAIFTICRLCGFMPGTEPHAQFSKALGQLITAYVTFLLKQECQGQKAEGEPQVLKLLNSNSETPYMIWNNGTRAELTEWLVAASDASIRGDPVELNFFFSQHKQELFVGGVFVRIYNEQPHYVLRDLPSFATRLISYIQKQVAKIAPLEESRFMDAVGMCLESLRNTLTTSPAIAETVAPHFKMLFSIFGAATAPLCQTLAELLLICTQNHDMVVKVAEAAVMSPLLVALTRHAECVLQLLHLLFSLAATTKTVGEMLDKGAYVLALFEFSTSRAQETREAAAQLVGKMASDKLSGPKIVLRGGKIMPLVFIETMKENPAGAGSMFDSSSENPELIWSADMRSRAVDTLTDLRQSVLRHLEEGDAAGAWRLPDDLGRQETVDEIQIAGVYLNLFVKQPSWGLRNPRKFLTDLMEEYMARCAESTIHEDIVDLISRCAVCLLNATPVLADQVPQLGHVPKFFKNVGELRPIVAHTSLQLLHQLALSRPVVESMGNSNCMQPLLEFIEKTDLGDSAVGQAIETVERIMLKNNPERGCAVKKAMDCNMPGKFLAMVESTNSSPVRAVLVKALKAMSGGNSPHCHAVKELLDANPKWRTYESQNHDLFLTKQTFAGYLTGPGGASGAMLSLTDGGGSHHAAHRSAPPPTRDAAGTYVRTPPASPAKEVVTPKGAASIQTGPPPTPPVKREKAPVKEAAPVTPVKEEPKPAPPPANPTPTEAHVDPASELSVEEVKEAVTTEVKEEVKEEPQTVAVEVATEEVVAEEVAAEEVAAEEVVVEEVVVEEVAAEVLADETAAADEEIVNQSSGGNTGDID
eukprot:TRINITY_DN3697_c0_g1_i1.p1 TRINITY_DN3697_c0_g1~~TRINITY_DN3697_c0_g1_i1.p1  ORF type:complete len:2385 (+),score=1004.85 TRINITY_DN3697_c0_g1_i1:97-7251(+)